MKFACIYFDNFCEGNLSQALRQVASGEGGKTRQEPETARPISLPTSRGFATFYVAF